MGRNLWLVPLLALAIFMKHQVSMSIWRQRHIHCRKKSSGNKITNNQDESHKDLITCEDSKVRIFDGVDMVRKFKGLPKSGSQMSASFTSTGKHIKSEKSV